MHNPFCFRELPLNAPFCEREQEHEQLVLHTHNKANVVWNIILFHYRNHGADFGRVLAAFEVPREEDHAFERFLDALGDEYEIDDGNEAYGRFLG